MMTLVSPKQHPVIKVLPAEPSLLITMPFEPKLNGERQLQDRLNLVVKKAEKLLMAQYPVTERKQVTERLNSVFSKLNFHCFKKSIAVFVSASSHKLLYLDVRLREEVQLNSSFQISELLELKETPVEYLVLVLNDHWAKTYYGNQSGFKLIKTDRPKPFHDVQMGSFSMVCSRKPVAGSLYRQIGDDFSLITSAYPLPVFLIGSVRNVNHFNRVVRNAKDIVQVIYSNTDNISESLIYQKLNPYFIKWNHLRYRYLRRQLDDAHRNGLVVFGKANIIDKSKRLSGKLLIIEAGYMFAGDADPVHLINSNGEMVPMQSNLRNDLERVMEKFLVNGGNVEVVPDGFLRDYDRIALMTTRPEAMLNYQVPSAAYATETF